MSISPPLAVCIIGLFDGGKPGRAEEPQGARYRNRQPAGIIEVRLRLSPGVSDGIGVDGELPEARQRERHRRHGDQGAGAGLE
jgi:hypothetical protein